jgi:tRNA pseudouridine55 synthase
MIEDILIINKPLNWTSFDVCKYLKRQYPKKTKIGHSGTLDPLASGVLVICIGKATKQIPQIQDTIKEYKAEITLGAVTTTYDAEFFPSKISDTSNILDEKIIIAIKSFIGEIEQIPPKYSAIKVDGKRAYDLARKDIDFELKARKIIIYDINNIKINRIEGITKIEFVVSCSKGTYIRTLANDIGVKLNCGAFLSGLIRTKVGEYILENSIEIIPNKI